MTQVISFWHFVFPKKDFKDYGLGHGTMSCPGCGKELGVTKPAYISVNAESKRHFAIKDMWIPFEKCNDPFCKWSNVKDD